MFNKEIMKKTYSILLLACYFFIFLIPESNRFYISFDRSDGQVLILSLLNFTTFGFLLANNILVKKVRINWEKRSYLGYDYLNYLSFLYYWNVRINCFYLRPIKQNLLFMLFNLNNTLND